MTVEVFDESALAADYGAAWNSHDLRAIMGLHTTDSTFRLQLLDTPLAVGHDQVRGAVESNGIPASFAGLDIITFRTGLVHTEETYLDIAEIMARMGAL